MSFNNRHLSDFTEFYFHLKQQLRKIHEVSLSNGQQCPGIWGFMDMSSANYNPRILLSQGERLVMRL